MKALLHICCAPCSIYCVKALRSESHEITGFFLNHNIHPYQEYLLRLDTFREYAAQIDLPAILDEDYDIEGFLRNVVFREQDRCYYCYYHRLKHTASLAQREGYDAFTTTLLYSRFQKHDLIKSIGNSLAKEYSIEFMYRDFRKGWKEGIEISKQLNMYRQQYCGCIYSEKERYKK
ncbi:MAG: epoxyqueuosine reductase QueH [Pseudomonadota bacterium]